MRIYELAKELKVENKALIARANELGMVDKKSHSNALNDQEVQKIRRSFLSDISAADPSIVTEKTLSTSVDEGTGQKSKLVEKRKGNVIRRRRTVVKEQPVEVKAEEVTPEETVAEPIVKEAMEAAAAVIQETVVEEAVTDEVASELVASEVQEDNGETVEAEEPVIEAVAPVAAEPVVPEPAPVKKTLGPKILGKMSLPTQPKRPSRDSSPKKSGGILSYATGQNKRKGKVVEFSRGDLVDYNTRKRKGRNVRGGDSDRANAAAATRPVGPVVKKPIKVASETITVGELASNMSLKSGQVIAKLIELGVMATINQPIDVETATIVADELGFVLEYSGFDEEDLIKIENIDEESAQVSRPPVVTVMGHVDHGKTSLLDYIRKAQIANKEHGGITQHIGAYVVDMPEDKSITFIDTPGHAAFTEMRARGADLTDIVILVVAADDGVMPQTLEALNHAQAAGTPIIVAVNKMDKEGANPEKIKTQLSERGLQPEDWGGDTMFVPVSALTGDGVDNLLESILLVAEVQELKANPECRVKGTVVEVRQEQGRGTVATVLVQAGTLKVGDIFLVGANHGRVRSMMDHNSKPITEALPSTPVELTGFSGVLSAGDDFIVMETEAKAKEVADHRDQRLREKRQIELAGGPISLEEFAKKAASLEMLELRVIIKADVHGSLQAVQQSLEDLSTEEVRLKVIHAAVGGVSESDIQLAAASNTIIVGFNVRGEPRALQQAESQGIETRFYRVIYELIDDIKKAMGGLLAPAEEEVNLARAEVRETFSVPKAGTIAGCYVVDGKIERGAKLRLLRDSVVVYEGSMGTLRRFKDDVKEVASGYECGMSIEGYNDIKIGDVIEVYKIKHVERTLD